MVKSGLQINITTPQFNKLTEISGSNYVVATVEDIVVNQQAGRIVIIGHYDSNINGKYDKTDKNQLLIYDLKTFYF